MVAVQCPTHKSQLLSLAQSWTHSKYSIIFLMNKWSENIEKYTCLHGLIILLYYIIMCWMDCVPNYGRLFAQKMALIISLPVSITLGNTTWHLLQSRDRVYFPAPEFWLALWLFNTSCSTRRGRNDWVSVPILSPKRPWACSLTILESCH